MIFTVVCFFIVGLSLYSDPWNTGCSLAVSLSGIPVYYLAVKRSYVPSRWRKAFSELRLFLQEKLLAGKAHLSTSEAKSRFFALAHVSVFSCSVQITAVDSFRSCWRWYSRRSRPTEAAQMVHEGAGKTSAPLRPSERVNKPSSKALGCLLHTSRTQTDSQRTFRAVWRSE